MIIVFGFLRSFEAYETINAFPSVNVRKNQQTSATQTFSKNVQRRHRHGKHIRVISRTHLKHYNSCGEDRSSDRYENETLKISNRSERNT